MNSKPVDNASLKRYAVFAAGMTFVLVWMGGMVTSKGVGMAVPDWPNTYGYNMFFFPVSKWLGGIFYEHSHRLVASMVGFLTIILALWLHGRKAQPVLRWGSALFVVAGLVCCVPFPTHAKENLSLSALGLAGFAASYFWPKCEASPRWMRTLGIVALIAVIVQGVLGGLRVIEMDQRIGIFHATLAQLFFLLMAAIALFQTNFWNRLPFHAETDRGHFRAYFVAATCLVLCQLILGATMRHQHAGLAIPDFPAAYGKIWPDTSAAAVLSYNQHRIDVNGDDAITAFQIILQMVHRLVALAILIVVGIGAWRVTKQFGRIHTLSRLAQFWLGLVCAQAFLGAATIWTGKSADIATAHVACGALCLLTGGLTSIISFRLLAAPAAEPQKNELTSLLVSSSIPR